MPDTPHDSDPPPTSEPRRFEVQGQVWVARLAGNGAGGTGAWGLGSLNAVHFSMEADPDTPLFEALLPGGRLEFLFPEELAALLAMARPIVIPAEPVMDHARDGRRPGRRHRPDDEPPVDG
jgi:hypothetical protein